ncbi:MAG TPA: glycogen debranching N-terminal domain-containing protein [Polyangiaceae bacterium]|nr:glycogen debranching N-terminal domain-containing protein [Polyangiaceae bacterium]
MIAHPLEILFGGGVGLACGLDSEIHADELHGLFAGDTRVLSTYRFTIGGHAWRCLSRSRSDPSVAQWDMQNPPLQIPGHDLEQGQVHCRLQREVRGFMRDRLVVTSFAARNVSVRLSLQLDADFMDLFQVRDRSLPARLNIQRLFGDRSLSFIYEHKDFRRGLHVSFEASGRAPVFVGSQVVFDIELHPREPWELRVEAVPQVQGAQGHHETLELQSTKSSHSALEITSLPLLAQPFERGSSDLERLSLHGSTGKPFVAAGAPWFLALFGRDTLMTSLLAGLLGRWHIDGALAELTATQAMINDPFRDAQPGKIAHELRQGELAHFHKVPHTPYYGTHDAPALFVLALWNGFRWTGDRSLLVRYLPAAKAALRWCLEVGDMDGDGLLEYQSHSTKGYRNQSWKDAHDAIVHQDGTLAEPPIATVELQGYLYAAQCAMAELLQIAGEHAEAEVCLHGARALQRLVEERFWMEDAQCYALALDGDKRPVKSIASNAGHLLWCGLPSPKRAQAVADRLLQDDMFSGFGVRTLSSNHCRYNPLSYQLGSVWPHDNAVFAVGLMRYGLREQAANVWKGILEAAGHFEQQRLPELFCGFSSNDGAPVPYEQANVPQAWAAAAPIIAVQSLLGLVPDAANSRCTLSPWLPDWLPELTLHGISVGNGHLDIKLSHENSETHLAYVKHSGVDVALAFPSAPLWGAPMI